MTQLDQARKGITTDAMRAVAKDEGLPEEAVRLAVAEGVAVIPCNVRRRASRLCGVGRGMRVKVNANIGTSRDFPDVEPELKKLESAVDAGADTVMDLSTGGDIAAVRERILDASPVGVGSVPIYDAAVRASANPGGVRGMSAADILAAVRRHCEQGVDFVTVHCGVNRAVVETLAATPRVCGVVSRGGAFLADWIRHNKAENPLYEQYDEILAMARELDVTLSLGDGMRPGALADSFDRVQVHELQVLSELCARAQEAGVQVMVEGPGHVPLDQVAAQVRLQKAMCKGAPFYVLGPIVTDVAPGYDHITSAIGGAAAAMAGADFLCYVTPAEHLGLPEAAHVREGVMAARIAAHAADVARGLPKAAEWDRRFSQMRRARDWPGMLGHCLDPRRAAALRDARNPGGDDVCSMCGDYCVFKEQAEAPARATQPKPDPAAAGAKP